MSKTKRNGFLKVAGLMMAVMMLAACVLSGTMAKYVSSGTVSGADLTAAKWSITVGGSDLTAGLSSLTWNVYKEGGSDKVTGLTAGDIAPGTWGYAEIKVTNDGDVDALVKAATSGVPSSTSNNLTFKVISRSTAPTSASELENEGGNDLTTGVALAKGGTASVNIYVCYEWKFDSSGSSGTYDEPDTTYGSDEQTFEFSSLTITAEQAEVA